MYDSSSRAHHGATEVGEESPSLGLHEAFGKKNLKRACPPLQCLDLP